ncbi:MAG: flagellar filament capping protein FliD [Planctomycetes bacterium]|nr:flagellar filament capping protein FliD [Planctomycetota bacterium]
MASPISFSGLGSGIDTRAIIDAMLAVERVPITQLEDKRKDNQDKINLINTFKGKVDTLRTKANALGSFSTFLSFKVNSSESGYATITASGSATAGTHTLVVNQLAATDRWAFDGVADPDADLATVDGQQVSFTYDGDVYAVRLDAASSSLNEIASAINSEAEDAVEATVVNAGTAAAPSWQLVLTAKETGEDFRLQGISSTVAGLTIDGTGPNGSGVAQSTNNISVGNNAQALIDGLLVERTDNDFDDVLTGVSISLLDADPATTVQFTVEPDKAGIKSKLKEFTDAYNDVVKFVRDQNKYDPEKGPGGALFGDSALRSIERLLQDALFGQSASDIANDTSGFGTIRLLGIESQSDGTLKINDKVMDAKLDEDIDQFADLFVDSDGFSNGGAAVGSTGYYTDVTTDTGLGDDLARAIDKIVKSYGNSNGTFSKGLFDARLESLNANIKQINARIDEREVRLERYEDQLVTRFAALESLMAQLQSQQSYLNAS